MSFDYQQAEKIFDAAGEYDPFDRAALLRTLAMVLSEADPLTVAHYAQRVKDAGYGVTKTEFMNAVRGATGGDGEKKHKPTDDEIAERWIATNDGDVAFGLGEWRRYSAGHWPAVQVNRVRREVLEICQSAKFEGMRPTSGRITSICDLAQVIKFIDDDRWNYNNNAVVLQNGTLDLETFMLREHSRDDYATIALPYGYDEEAKALVFDYVLHSTIPDAADFIQEFAGYCLTTDTSLETALWFYGLPGSGKSTILHGLKTMLGDMCGLLGLAAIEKSQFALSSLPGRRLVISTEQPDTYMQASWVLNSIISGEPVRIEEKFKPSYTITPYTKIAWAMNSLPRVGSPDDGIFRRVKVIKFTQLTESERDGTLKERISAEAPGILNWAIAGLIRLRERGRFEVPGCVSKVTDDFKSENDKPALFVADSCVTGDGYSVQSSALYEAYRVWCLNNGHKPASSTFMAREWERLGFRKHRINGKSWWDGVGIQVAGSNL